jgi:opacity protein-like surface antigen
MKYQTILASTLGLLSASSLWAGEVAATTTHTQATYSPPFTEHLGWFLGGGVDYMLDAEEAYYNGHVGYDFGNGSSLLLEAGWLGEDEDPSFLLPFAADVDIVPVTLNFKHEFMFTDKFGFYLGVGAGGANVDVSMGAFGGDEWVLTAQAFAGLVYNVTPNFEIYAGARYLWMDDVDFAGASLDDLDDVGLGAGIRFNF